MFEIPGVKLLEPSVASLLGSPIGDGASVSDAILQKLGLLHTMRDRLQHITAHDALLLLCNSFAIPKLLYLLRSAPSFLSPKLKLYDEELRAIVSTIANTDLDDAAWIQASLPVKAGGLGIQSTVHLAPSAFLSSTSASRDLVHEILPARFGPVELMLPLHHGQKITIAQPPKALLHTIRSFGMRTRCHQSLMLYLRVHRMCKPKLAFKRHL